MANLQPLPQTLRPLIRPPQPPPPIPSNGKKPRIQSRPKPTHNLRKRLSEIPVLPLPEPIPPHVHSSPKPRNILVQLRNLNSLVVGQQPGKQRAPQVVD